MKKIQIILFSLLTFVQVSSKAEDTIQMSDSSDVLMYKEQLKSSAAVAPFGDTLFFIHGNVGTITAVQRAKFVEDNIIKLRKVPFFNADSLMVVGDEVECDVIYGENIIFGITAPQAHFAGKTKIELANEYRDIVAKAVIKEQQDHKLSDLLKEIALALLIVIATFFAIKYLNVLCRKIVEKLKHKGGKVMESLGSIVNKRTQKKFFIFLVNIIRIGLILLLLYVCLLMVSHIFPTTRGFSEMLLSYILTPLKKSLLALWHFMPRLFEIIVIWLIFHYIIKGIKALAVKIAEGAVKIKGFHQDWAMSTFQLVKVVLIIFMLIFIFPLLPNSHTGVFKGISIFAGILFSLGSTSVVSNIVSGLVITYMRPFKVGDRIKMGEHVGEVIEKTSLVTRIKNAKNEVITIPNSSMMTAQTINYSTSARDHGLIVHSCITLGHSVSWRKVQELMIKAALAIPDVQKDPKPYVLQTAVDNSKIQYEINVHINDANKMHFVLSELHQNILDSFEEEGIQISNK